MSDLTTQNMNSFIFFPLFLMAGRRSARAPGVSWTFLETNVGCTVLSPAGPGSAPGSPSSKTESNANNPVDQPHFLCSRLFTQLNFFSHYPQLGTISEDRDID